MENKCIINSSADIKKDIFDLKLHNIDLKVHNITTIINEKYPRRLVKRIETSEIYLQKILIYNFNHHIRPGTTSISELDFLQDSVKLKQIHINNFIKHIESYCNNFIEYITHSECYFYYLMKDYLCFDNVEGSFDIFFDDFLQAYNCFHGENIKRQEFSIKLEIESEIAWKALFLCS